MVGPPNGRTTFDFAGQMPVRPSLAGWLLNQAVRSRQHLRCNRHADLFGFLWIDHQLELRRLFHGQVSGFGRFRILST